mmetsp:Transcript_7850/g.9446  ORF Transcript_7850/g.9446 Transcript_7850/m.9446 type:complete len:81 (-) Transcript_7850:194-436(-)|eukprot:CAMPEP_0118803294 /NCGR_PEP_ID=MMETSP1161-20130426/16142_1 /TAXON_ID=249345 /ORGANISM="Picochlorum oklahomensis, Strain CCMP2329" /LENGTH=80 /DNA_ID=CAMNT_0006731771 /DNA_START=37 /DNA_END=279 /DNA_ORIENTATION=+
MSNMSGIFKGLGSTCAKVLASADKRDFMVIGLGTGAFACGIMSWSSLKDDFMKDESPYARRYFGKYRQYNLEKAEKAGHH